MARMHPQTIRDPGMDPSYLVPIVQAGTGGLMPWELFSWHIFDYLVSTEHCLAYLMVASSKIRCHVTNLKHENQFTVLRWPLQSPDHNLIEYLRDVVEWEICL